MRIKFKKSYLIFGIPFILILLTCLLVVVLNLSEGENITRSIKNDKDKKETPVTISEPQITSKSQKEYDVFSDIWELFKILAFAGISTILLLLLYSAYRFEKDHNKRIKEINGDIINLKRIIKQGSKPSDNKYEGGMRGGEFLPTQEISKIYQKIEFIEKKINNYNEEHKKFLEELQYQQRVFNLLQDILKKENSIHSIRENIFQDLKELNNIRKEGVPYAEKKGKEIQEQRKEVPQFEKPIDEIILIEWWNKSGNQKLLKFKEILNDIFSNVILETVHASKLDNEDWKLIAIKDKINNYFYILPRLYTEWWPEIFQKWFVLEEEGRVAAPVIKSVITPLPKALKNNYGEWELLGPKGKVSIKETQ